MGQAKTLSKAKTKALEAKLCMDESGGFDLSQVEAVCKEDPKILETAPLIEYVVCSGAPVDEQWTWVEWLVNARANPNLTWREGQPGPVATIAQWPDVSLATKATRLLLDAGADPDDVPAGVVREALGLGAPAPKASVPEVGTTAGATSVAAPFDKPSMDAQLLRLAPFAPGGVDDLRARLEATARAPGEGPWGYLERALDALRPALRVDEAGRAIGPLLGLLIRGREACFPDAHRDGELSASELKSYPKAAQAGLKKGVVVAQHGADVWYLVAGKDKVAQVFHAHPEGVWELGRSVPEFVEKELARIGG